MLGCMHSQLPPGALHTHTQDRAVAHAGRGGAHVIVVILVVLCISHMCAACCVLHARTMPAVACAGRWRLLASATAIPS
jgi:hypothetical protein